MAPARANKPHIPLLAPRSSGAELAPEALADQTAQLQNPSAWLLSNTGIAGAETGQIAELSPQGAAVLGGAILDVATLCLEEPTEHERPSLRVVKTLFDAGVEATRRQYPSVNDSWIAGKVTELGTMLSEAGETLGGPEVMRSMILRRLDAVSATGSRDAVEAVAFLRALLEPTPAASAPPETQFVLPAEPKQLEQITVNPATPARRMPVSRGTRLRAVTPVAGEQEVAADEVVEESDDVIDESAVEAAVHDLDAEVTGLDRSRAAGANRYRDYVDLVRVYLQQIGLHPLLTREQVIDCAKRIEAGLYAAKIIEVSDMFDGGDIPEPQRLSLILSTYHGMSKGNQKGLSPDDHESIKINPQRMKKAEAVAAELIEGVKGHLGENGTLPETLKGQFEILAADGTRAKQTLIESNLRLVVYFAKRASSRRMQMLDYIQDGSLGLIRAAEKYDYTRDAKFSTYASRWIKQFIKIGIQGFDDPIRRPIYMHTRMNKMRSVEVTLRTKLGREPTLDEVADGMQVTVAEVEEYILLQRDMLSLDKPINSDTDTTLYDVVKADEHEQESSGSGYFNDLSQIDGLWDAMCQSLPEADLQLARMAFGMDGSPEYSYTDIARQFNTTLVTARRMKTRLMLKLMHPSSSTRTFIVQSVGISHDRLGTNEAQCRDEDLGEFFQNRPMNRTITKYCGKCSLQQLCGLEGTALGLQFGRKEHNQMGVWGGKMSSERQQIVAAIPNLAELAERESPVVAALADYAR